MIFKTKPIEGGYTWTVTSKLGAILRVAEERFGERDKSYTILGVELTCEEIPQIWYPGNCKNIVIQISMSCENDINRAVFQVAHEVIHCLCPTGKQNANIFEEGLATLFSIEYCKNNGHGDNWTAVDHKYINAYNIVNEVLEIDNEIVKKLRLMQPTISLFDKDLIIKTNSNIPIELAEKLTKKF